MSRSEELQPIATRIIYEDDEVRVWDQVIEAGATLEKHRHDLDYVLVTVRGEGPLGVEFHDKTSGEAGERITMKTHRGQALLVPKGQTETAYNEGEEYRAILVELKT